MTNTNQKAKIRERMAETGESYAEARRKVIGARPRRQPGAEPEKIYVSYTLNLDGQLEFDAVVWANALSNERTCMVEEAVGEQLDDDFALYGGQGIAKCVERGELAFDTTTEAEIEAKHDSESIEIASRAYAGIGDYDDWPDSLERPSGSDSYVTEHQGVEYVVLRRQRSIVAVYDIADGGYIALGTWPKEIETR